MLINKTDLEIRLDEREITDRYPEWPVIHMSLVQDRGLDALEDTIYNLVFSDGIRSSDAVMVTRVRHEDCLKRAKRSLGDAIRAMKGGLPVDLVSIDIKAALEALGEITGDNITEEIVDRIFADFCIGK